MGESSYVMDVVLPRLRERASDRWMSAVELCVTPQSLRRLAHTGYAARYHDGKRWLYKATTQ